ncbi:MAG: hypothetical protein RMK29_01260 [Myxococcales bacterium]|nr:hypothetical protein [Myxococcota bacterium]MDW8280306.1 hypothetical protein [Myxococcales bacterium]
MKSPGMAPTALWTLLLACAGPRGGALPPVGPDQPLLAGEEGLRAWPVRGAQRPPPTHLDEEVLSASPAEPELPPPPVPPPHQGDRSKPPPSAPPLAPEASRGPSAGRQGTILRAELLRILDQSPALFLRQVDSEPRFEGGRFRGWYIHSFFPGDPRFVGIDLMRGDVVTRINGQPIEMPEQFIAVWEKLRQARELRVELLRNGQPHVARWAIVD